MRERKSERGRGREKERESKREREEEGERRKGSGEREKGVFQFLVYSPNTLSDEFWAKLKPEIAFQFFQVGGRDSSISPSSAASQDTLTGN